MNLLASLHNKFTCVDRTSDEEWPCPMTRWGLKTGRATTCKTSLYCNVRYVWYREAKTIFLCWCIIRRSLQLGVLFYE